MSKSNKNSVEKFFDYPRGKLLWGPQVDVEKSHSFLLRLLCANFLGVKNGSKPVKRD